MDIISRQFYVSTDSRVIYFTWEKGHSKTKKNSFYVFWVIGSISPFPGKSKLYFASSIYISGGQKKLSPLCTLCQGSRLVNHLKLMRWRDARFSKKQTTSSPRAIQTDTRTHQTETWGLKINSPSVRIDSINILCRQYKFKAKID